MNVCIKIKAYSLDFKNTGTPHRKNEGSDEPNFDRQVRRWCARSTIKKRELCKYAFKQSKLPFLEFRG